MRIFVCIFNAALCVTQPRCCFSPIHPAKTVVERQFLIWNPFIFSRSMHKVNMSMRHQARVAVELRAKRHWTHDACLCLLDELPLGY